MQVCCVGLPLPVLAIIRQFLQPCCFGFQSVANKFSISANEQRIHMVINLDFITDVDFAVIDRETKISTHHKYPGSIGLGLNYVVNKKVTTYLSAEYFLPLDQYYVFSSNTKPKSYPELSEPEIEHVLVMLLLSHLLKHQYKY